MIEIHSRTSEQSGLGITLRNSYEYWLSMATKSPVGTGDGDKARAMMTECLKLAQLAGSAPLRHNSLKSVIPPRALDQVPA